MKLINIGFGNMVSDRKIVSIVSPDSAPVKRLVRDAGEKGMLIDATYGRKTKSVIIADSGHVILSALTQDVIYERNESEERVPPVIGEE